MDIQLKCLPSNSRHKTLCHISRETFHVLQLSDKKQYYLKFGNLTNQTTISPCDEKSKNNRDIIYIRSDFFSASFSEESLSNFDGITLNIWKEGRNIKLGPVIGIFINPKRFKFYKNGTTDPIHLIAGIDKSTLCYLFSLDSIDWTNKRISGITYLPKVDKWTKIWLPLPNVVYDRGSEFTRSQKVSVKQIRSKLKNEEGIQFINNRDYIGKWKLYKFLLKYELLATHLPQTVRYKNINDILIMLKRYQNIYLKSVYGKRGKQVMAIRKMGTQHKYKLNYYSKGLQEFELNSHEQLKEHIDKFVGDRHFVVQQGISLLKYQGRSFDLRILLNKDIQGQWQVMRNYGRVALQKNQILTNYSIGSERIYYREIYADLCKTKDHNIPTTGEIEELAIKLACIIDREFGYFGELGLDLAIDVNGKLWILEVNTKPSKGFELVSQNNQISAEYKAIFDYAKYLCGVLR